MSKSIQANYTFTYDNKKPDLMYDIKDVSEVVKTRFNKKLGNARTVQEMLQRPVRYVFNVTELIPKATSCKMHVCYYDNEAKAKKAHQEVVRAYYDQMNAPMLKRLTKGRGKLTSSEQNRILEIQNIFKKF